MTNEAKKANMRVLIVDDERNMLTMLSTYLNKAGYITEVAGGGLEALAKVEQVEFQCVLCDVKMPHMDGIELLQRLMQHNQEMLVIMMSAYATVNLAVEAMKNGAFDFISKPFKMDEVTCVLEKAREYIELKQENLNLKQRVKALSPPTGFTHIIGESTAITELKDRAGKVAGYDTSVMITGESGTGKELLARGIHSHSARAEEPLIAVNCGSIPEALMESEFFGYSKGAFTGAENAREGLFLAADNGTLFLDEVGELPAGLQVKFLRVLQEQEVRPIGSTTTRPVNVRILAATSRNLSHEVERGAFRQDLLFRLNVIELSLPPLRERYGDIPLLVSHFAKKLAGEMGVSYQQISEQAMRAFAGYHWPGNIRELQNAVEHSLIYAVAGVIDIDCLPQHIIGPDSSSLEETFGSVQSLKKGKLLLERVLIQKAIDRTGGNKSRASELLEISYPSLLQKMKEHRIDGPST